MRRVSGTRSLSAGPCKDLACRPGQRRPQTGEEQGEPRTADATRVGHLPAASRRRACCARSARSRSCQAATHAAPATHVAPTRGGPKSSSTDWKADSSGGQRPPPSPPKSGAPGSAGAQAAAYRGAARGAGTPSTWASAPACAAQVPPRLANARRRQVAPSSAAHMAEREAAQCAPSGRVRLSYGLARHLCCSRARQHGPTRGRAGIAPWHCVCAALCLRAAPVARTASIHMATRTAAWGPARRPARPAAAPGRRRALTTYRRHHPAERPEGLQQARVAA